MPFVYMRQLHGDDDGNSDYDDDDDKDGFRCHFVVYTRTRNCLQEDAGRTFQSPKRMGNSIGNDGEVDDNNNDDDNDNNTASYNNMRSIYIITIIISSLY